MFLKKILDGYGHIISSIFKVLLLIAICTTLGFVIVFPLWKWASTSPRSYTIIILALCAIIFVYYLIRFFKGKKFSAIIRILLLTACIIAMLVSPIYFVINLHRLYALLSFVFFFVVFTLIKFGIKK